MAHTSSSRADLAGRIFNLAPGIYKLRSDMPNPLHDKRYSWGVFKEPVFLKDSRFRVTIAPTLGGLQATLSTIKGTVLVRVIDSPVAAFHSRKECQLIRLFLDAAELDQEPRIGDLIPPKATPVALLVKLILNGHVTVEQMLEAHEQIESMDEEQYEQFCQENGCSS